MILDRIIGQNRLKQFIVNSDLTRIPKVLLFIGEIGCGKKLFSTAVAEQLNLSLYNISNKLTSEDILNYYAESKPAVYLIEIDTLDLKKQNTILKFIEEPPTYAFIILTSSSKNKLLPTVLNRCSVIEFERYTPAELASFSTDSELLKYCTTPGQLIDYAGINVLDLATYCDKIVDKIGSANISNLFMISDKIAFKNEKEKYDLNLFIAILLKKYRLKFIEDIRFGHSYKLVADYNNQRITNSSFNQRALFEVLLLDLHEANKV